MNMPAVTVENSIKLFNELDNLLDRMEITNSENEPPTLLHSEKVVVKIQLLVAQIIVKDISTLRNDGLKKSTNVLLKILSKNWMDNISDFVKIILSNPSFQINIDQILDDQEEIR